MFPSDGGEMVEIPISAQTLKIYVISLWEINSNTWRVISGIGMLTGILILGISIILKKPTPSFQIK